MYFFLEEKDYFVFIPFVVWSRTPGCGDSDTVPFSDSPWVSAAVHSSVTKFADGENVGAVRKKSTLA